MERCLVCLSFCFLFFVSFLHISFAGEGLNFSSDYFHPGKADFHYLHDDSSNQYNFIWWSPTFKGGWGIIDYDNKTDTKYYGGYIRPLLPKSGKGELILGYLEVDGSTSDDYEFQGEYRFPFGLGFGGGFVSRSAGGKDVEFGKITYRTKDKKINYILELQYQEMGDDGACGGYMTVYNEEVMFTFGDDGEQWRAVLGYIAPKGNEKWRPAFEIMYVDNTVGDIDGNKFLFINATLGFKGGFLSHPARLGRAMGPQGLEFGNPLGFLSPTWNRRLDTWELGDLADFRIVRTEKPSGAITDRTEFLIFPFQFDDNTDILDALYIGGFYARDPVEEDSSGILGGIFGKFGFLTLGVGGDYNFDTGEKRVIVGIIDKF